MLRRFWDQIRDPLVWAAEVGRGMLFALFSILILLAVLGVITVVSWHYAKQSHENGPRRVRVFVGTTGIIEPGAPVTERQVKLRLGGVAEDDWDLVTVPATAVGQYAIERLEPGTPLRRAYLRPTPALSPPAGGSIFSVLVNPDHGRALVPGMRVAFVKGTMIIPTPAVLSTEPGPRGFLVLAVMPPDKSMSKSTVLVEVGPCKTTRAAPLGDGEWTPVVLGR